MSERIKVTQTRSAIGHTKRQKDTLGCLGLGKSGRQVEHNLTSDVRGMISSVSHLVRVERISG